MKNNVIKRLLPRLAAALLIGAGIFTHFALASAGEKAAAVPEVDEPIERAAATEIPFVDAPNIFYGVPTGDPNSKFNGYSISSQANHMLEGELLRTRNFEYVDYYGGAFNAYDQDIFYVYITDLTKVPELNKALGEYAEGVIFLPAKYSYNYLMDLAESTFDELVAAGIRATGFGPDTNYGKQQVMIGILPEDLELAKEYVNKHYPDPELFELVGMGYLECSTLPDPSDAETSL